MKARIHIGKRLEEVAIARHGKGYTCSAHNGSVEADEHRQRHACRDDSGSPGADGNCSGLRGGTFGTGDS